MLEKEDILDFEEEEKEIELATINQRFVNRLIDTIVIGFTIGMLSGFIPKINTGLNLNISSWFWNSNSFVSELLQMLIYYSAFEFLIGQSPGKMLTRTKVVTKEGHTPTFDKILIRSLCRSIPFNAVSFLINDDGTGWHDRISGTRVIQQL